MWHVKVNPVSIRVLTSTKMFSQLHCTRIHNAIFARKRTQCVIMRMPLTQSVCSEVDNHELGPVVGRDPMQLSRRKSNATQYAPYLDMRHGRGDKCRCKSQLRSHGHRLEQISCRKGMIAGTVFNGHQEAGQASVSCWRSKKDGQVFYERGPHGTCQTCVGFFFAGGCLG